MDSPRSTTWANPDGSFETKMTSAPTRWRSADGSWRDVDLTLTRSADGSWSPAASGVPVRVPATAAGSVGLTGGLSLSHPDAGTASAAVAGATATYPGPDGGSLVLRALTSGLEESVVVPSATVPGSYTDVFALPAGVTARQSAGAVEFIDSSGALVASFGSGAAHDSSTTDAGVAVSTTLVSVSARYATVRVGVDAEWLADPTRAFPVTIDPLYYSNTSTGGATGGQDSWVESDSSTSQYTSTELRVGYGYGSLGTAVARTLVEFQDNNSVIPATNVVVTEAHMEINQSTASKCVVTYVKGLAAGFSNSTLWNNQPAFDSHGVVSTTTLCHGWNQVDMTAVAQRWFNRSEADYGVVLQSNESSSGGWEKFYSGETGGNSAPALYVTYNHIPNTPSALTSSPAAPCAAGSGRPGMDTTTPSLLATLADADGGSVQGTFEVWPVGGSAALASGSVSVSSRGQGSWTVPVGTLVDGGTYSWRVRAYDGALYSPWSSSCEFTVDTTEPPAPAISSPTWTAGAWTGATSGTISWSDTASDVATYSWRLDGGTWSSATTSKSISLSNLADDTLHTFSVKATDKAGNVSTAGTYTFGVGTGGLTSPHEQDRTQADVTLAAAGPGSEPYVAYQWRRGTTATWANVPLANLTTPGTTTHPAAWPVPIGDKYTWSVVGTAGATDGLIQVRACLYTSTADTSPTCQASVVSIETATHAFGASYATEQVGPGTVALLTGDYDVSATDVNITSPLANLTISRDFTTLAPTGERSDPTGVFGPGWTASLTGPNAGAGELEPTIALDKSYIVLTDAGGGASVYQATSGLTASPIKYTGLADANDGSMLSYDFTNAKLTLTDAEGTQTVWNIAGTTGTVDHIITAASATSTSYTYSAGLVTRILAPVPAGVDCSNPAAAGCRSLAFSYASIAGHTRLVKISLAATDPATGNPSTVDVAAYDYDGNGQLVDEYDPRITPNLKTTYSYDGNGRLATLTPPGQAAWTLTYDTNGRLSAVSRPDPSGQTAARTVVYDDKVPFTGGGTGGSTGLPDLGVTRAAQWNETSDLPARAAAVFPTTHVPAASPTAADWPYATLHYLDANGREVNTAGYANAWQIDTSQYDQQGNTIWQLTAENRNQALNPTDATAGTVAALPDSADRADALATITSYNVDGTELTDTLGPTHPIALNDTSTVQDARAHTHTDYDQGAPDGGPYQLPTTQTVTADTGDGVQHDPAVTHTGYDPFVAGDPSGWALRLATSQTDAGGLISTTRYNAARQVIEITQPNNGNNAGARTSVTTYYTTSGSGACVSPAQAGQVCSVGPKTQPATGNPLPVTTYTYDLLGDVLTKTERAGTTVRTTAMSYDEVGRPLTQDITVTPAADGGTPVPTVHYDYDPNTGLPTTVSSDDGQTISAGYDNLGQVTHYTDAAGNTTTTSYDLAGRKTAVNDGKGTTIYTYDPYSGQLVGEDAGTAAQPAAQPGQFSAGYDADGNLTSQTYPNGLVATTVYDNAGQPDSLAYTKDGSTWLSFTADRDAQGRIINQASPASSQVFGYDDSGRLTSVTDRVPDPGSGTVSCTVRAYRFDNDSNRTGYQAYLDDGTDPINGHCATPQQTLNPTTTFDDADRITAPGYTYDTLGRTTTVPASDAAGSGSHAAITGDLTVAYYANDMVATQTQAAQTMTFQLDPLQNRIGSFTGTDGTGTTNHYADDGDSPSWTQTGTTWARNITGPGGGLAAIETAEGQVSLQLTNLHGDVVGVCVDDPNAVTTDSYTESTEYGQPRDTESTSDTYGWTGSAQRSANALGGTILMGVRLYNPATGRFLSTDPIPGGNANAYCYPLDPINQGDATGKWVWWLYRHVFYLSHHQAAQWAYRLEMGGSLADLISPYLRFVPYAGTILWILDEVAGGSARHLGMLISARNGRMGVGIAIYAGLKGSWWWIWPILYINVSNMDLMCP